MESMENSATLLIGTALICALLIERLLEIIKAWFEYREARDNRSGYWDSKAEEIARRLTLSRDTASDLLGMVARRYLAEDVASAPNAMVISADRVRRSIATGRYTALGIILGILISYVLDLNLFVLVQAAQGQTGEPSTLASLSGTLAMGISMGLGATPLHEIIARLEKASPKTSSKGA